MSFSKFASFVSKVLIEVGGGGISLSSFLDCNIAKLRNECFSLFMLSLFFKARADTLPREAKQWNIWDTSL